MRFFSCRVLLGSAICALPPTMIASEFAYNRFAPGPFGLSSKMGAETEMVGEGVPVTGEMPCAAPAIDANSSDVTLFLTWRHTRSPDTGEAI
jgi:hypothetical protein